MCGFFCWGSASGGAAAEDAQKTALSGAFAQMNDFTPSVSRKPPCHRTDPVWYMAGRDHRHGLFGYDPYPA